MAETVVAKNRILLFGTKETKKQIERNKRERETHMHVKMIQWAVCGSYTIAQCIDTHAS